MKEDFKQFISNLNKPKFYLISANVLLAFFLILLSNLGVLPIKNLGDFSFFAILFLVFALYRPGWSFLFFAGTIALENISVAPESLGITVRPYQFFAAVTIFAVLVRLLVKRLNFKLPEWKWIDIAVIIFAVAGFASAFINLLGVGNADLRSLQQSIIAASFVAIYFLVRIFVQNLDDLKKLIPFFLSSSVIVILYGIWQNWRFMRGLNPFEIMPGRPNSTFTEPDWLGIFLVLLLAVIYSLVYFFQHCHSDPALAGEESRFGTSSVYPARSFATLRMTVIYAYLILVFVLLILTVSRSAWLGAGIITFLFLLITFTNLSFKILNWQWRQSLSILYKIAIAMLCSIGIVYVFGLTNFQLFNRIQSTGTGLQKITVSCNAGNADLRSLLPEKINNVSELSRYGCRHINLEDIEKEKLAGNFVKEVYRHDPSVNIRSVIYQKSWEEIKKHPVLGIGWGSIESVLGKDERGVSLNSSNIFLEVWLGAGILGLLALILIWTYILIKGVKFFLKSDLGGKSLGLFLFLGAISLLVPNIFNAGIFLGILWLFFGITLIQRR